MVSEPLPAPISATSGLVYSTELTAARLDEIRQAAGDAGLRNVTVLAAGERAPVSGLLCSLPRWNDSLTDRAILIPRKRPPLHPGPLLALELATFLPHVVPRRRWVPISNESRETPAHGVEIRGAEAVVCLGVPQW